MYLIVSALFLLLAPAATSAYGNKPNTMARDLERCNFIYLVNSYRKHHYQCYDRFDDCGCMYGFFKSHGKCIEEQIYRNDYKYPSHSSRRSHPTPCDKAHVWTLTSYGFIQEQIEKQKRYIDFLLSNQTIHQTIFPSFLSWVHSLECIRPRHP